MPYRILFPQAYDKTKNYPLIVFLHGSGERGSDNEQQLLHGSQMFLVDSIRKSYPAIVIFPQCPESDSWESPEYASKSCKDYFEISKRTKTSRSLLLVNQMVDGLVKSERVDEKRMYVIGLSMGGFGTFETISRWPKKYAAAIPICGGGSVVGAKRYAKRVALWIFHGAEDKVVSPDFSRKVYESLQEKKADVRYTEYPNVTHGSWKKAFVEPELFSWLFSKHK